MPQHLLRPLPQERDSEGFSLHGGPVTPDGRFNPTLQYRCEQGQLWTSLLAASFQLSDHNPGDGGFCVVRSSQPPPCNPRSPPCNPTQHRLPPRAPLRTPMRSAPPCALH